MSSLFQNQYDQVKGQYTPGAMGPNSWNKIPGDCLAAILKELLVIANFYQLWNPLWTRKDCEMAAFNYYAHLRVPHMQAVSSHQEIVLESAETIQSASAAVLDISEQATSQTMNRTAQSSAVAQLAVSFAALDSPALKKIASRDKGQLLKEAAKYMILPSSNQPLPQEARKGDAEPMDLIALNKQFNPDIFSPAFLSRAAQ